MELWLVHRFKQLEIACGIAELQIVKPSHPASVLFESIASNLSENAHKAQATTADCL
jgi:hypothetical protein